MAIRWQWAYPGKEVPAVGKLLMPKSGGVITPATYASIFTMHGLIMIFFAITPLLIGAFGNLTIPLMIGARDMAFPLLNAMSFWTFLISQGLVLASFVVQLGARPPDRRVRPPRGRALSLGRVVATVIAEH